MSAARTAFAACIGLASAALVLSPPAAAGELDLYVYQGPTGEIHLTRSGDTIDPYFATKGLLEAKHAGANVQRAGTAWIEWALRKQLPDGRFERYCQAGPGDWRACASADADDAMLAVWLQLLAEIGPADPPPAWRESIDRAERQLQHLYDPRREIYLISSSQPVGLFIDNVEIYAALRALADWKRRSGMTAEAERFETRASRLQRALVHVFWEASRRSFRISTQTRAPLLAHDFYPDEVAQIYPWIEAMPTPYPDSEEAYRDWMRRVGPAWLQMESDHYPWGLVAVAALRMNDQARAACWLNRAGPLRHGARWNVLEESIFQALAARFGTTVPCPVETKA